MAASSSFFGSSISNGLGNMFPSFSGARVAHQEQLRMSMHQVSNSKKFSTALKATATDSDFGNKELKDVEMAPPDAILSLSVGYKNDANPNKVNLGIGAYRDETGKPYVFPVVRQAEEMIIGNKDLDKEYSPIDGDPMFNKGARGVLFGWDHEDVNSGRVASAQTLSGTGALRVLADFLIKHRPAQIYVSNPTWGNHNALFKSAGFDV